jgi:cell division initiation protein
MKLTPLEVRKQEFGRQMRGYDQDEVNSFLESVAGEYEAAINQTQDLTRKLDAMQNKLQNYQEMEGSLQDAAVNATKAAKDVENRSGREADLLVQEARLEAEQIIADSRKKRDSILDDIARLEGQRRSFILTLKHILRNQVDLLEVIEHDPMDKIMQNKKSAGAETPAVQTERSPRDQQGSAR